MGSSTIGSVPRSRTRGFTSDSRTSWSTSRVDHAASPALADARTFRVTVNETNHAPALPAADNLAVDEQTTLTLDL